MSKSRQLRYKNSTKLAQDAQFVFFLSKNHCFCREKKLFLIIKNKFTYDFHAFKTKK